MGDKQWVEVYFENENIFWVPKLIDLAEIVAKIGICEDEKYGFPKMNIKGAQMVSEYLTEAIDLGIVKREELEELSEKFKIPK